MIFPSPKTSTDIKFCGGPDHVQEMLMPGDAFPRIELNVVGGDGLVLPDALAGSWAYIMVYRGHW